MSNQYKGVTSKSASEGRKFAAFLVLAVMLVFSGCNGSPAATSTVSEGLAVERLKAEAEEILRKGLDDDAPQVRVNAIEVVAATGRTEMMPKVSQLLRDDFVPVRYAALCAVGDMKYRGATKTVRQLLNDPDERCRLAAAYTLTKLGEMEGTEVLVRGTTSDDQMVRANAVVLLGKMGDKRVLNVLYAAKDSSSSDMGVRMQAAEAIASLGDETIYTKLWTLLISKYPEDKIIGIRAMGALGTAEGKNAVITMLDNEMAEVRLAAAQQLGALGDRTGEPEVLDVFTRNITANMDRVERERVRALAALAIGEIRGQALARYLPGLLKDDSPVVRLAAAQAVLKYD